MYHMYYLYHMYHLYHQQAINDMITCIFTFHVTLPPHLHLFHVGEEGFIRRLVGVDRRLLYGESLEKAAIDAIENLENIWVVGVVEQYSGFEEVLKRLLDPEGKHEKLWQKYAKERYNT